MTDRVASGPMRAGGDWPGVFIRGDEALGYAWALQRLLAVAAKDGDTIDPDALADWASVAELVTLLKSCRVPAPFPKRA